MVEMVDTGVTYEQLADLEREFEEVENQIVRKQYELSKPLYEKRAAVTSKIPNFWALVFEQSPAEVDEHIQPSDAALLLSSLKNISVSRPEIDNGAANGDPRTLSIRFEFNENEYFEDKVIEKTFWYRHSKSYSGLVSEPVDIKWKDGKDLTEGLLSLAKKVWDQGPITPGKLTPEAEALKAKVEETGMGGVSFFTFFGFVGKRISPEDSAATLAKEVADHQARKEGKKTDEEEDDEEEEAQDQIQFELEICPDGDDIAVAIATDLWPEALHYFSKSLRSRAADARGEDGDLLSMIAQAQEAAEMSDADFESDDDEDEDEEMGDAEETTPNKKRRA
ncbi:Putative nucleosome assembly protein (NAP) [Colletotrichum destructivum]|uniref:Nucleosome assembly protein (NAP) n=1 Tax=Colletotrichum destructivum TaxID=34406 RepID=A0AAX4I9I3_9PEZI|nr:Putative nucleosome assembly protein (NAP) [Colletotrichum destructivum]